MPLKTIWTTIAGMDLRKLTFTHFLKSLFRARHKIKGTIDTATLEKFYKFPSESSCRQSFEEWEFNWGYWDGAQNKRQSLPLFPGGFV